MHKKNLLIVAGGTGGHVFPGLAVAQRLQDLGWQVHWLGTKTHMEARLVPTYQIPCSFIDIQGLRRKGILGYFLLPWRLTKAIYQAKKVIHQVKPDVVLGFGGFVAAPGGIAAWLSQIPLLIHEQNAVMGLTNRLLTRISHRILLGFSTACKRKDKKVIVVGNPVRQDLLRLKKPVFAKEAQPLSHPLKLLVMGGSLGAKKLNESVPQALSFLQEPIEICHQTGQAHLQSVKALYESQGYKSVRVEAFIDDMAQAYHWADLVLCRAGALTISELIHVKKPSILVPYPYAVDDHQTHNAQFLVAQGAAWLLPEAQITSEYLASIIQELQTTPKKREDMQKALVNLPTQDAARVVADICEQTYQQGTHT